MWEQAPGVNGFSCLRLPFSQGKEFISEKFQFLILKLSCLTPKSLGPCIRAHPITIGALFPPSQASLSLSVKKFSFWQVIDALFGSFYTMRFLDSPGF